MYSTVMSISRDRNTDRNKITRDSFLFDGDVNIFVNIMLYVES